VVLLEIEGLVALQATDVQGFAEATERFFQAKGHLELPSCQRRHMFLFGMAVGFFNGLFLKQPL